MFGCLPGYFLQLLTEGERLCGPKKKVAKIVQYGEHFLIRIEAAKGGLNFLDAPLFQILSGGANVYSFE